MFNAKCKISNACLLMVAAVLSQTAEAQNEPPLTYRRIFVPAEKVEAWPTEGRKFLPVESRDFERWMKAANQPDSGLQRRAVIASAEYFAKLDGNRLVGGRGEWTIALRGEEPAFLPLGHMSIVMREARWRDAQQSVRMGTWGNGGGLATTQGFEVSRSGALEFQWSVRSEATHKGIEVPCRLPRADSTRLVLELPEHLEPHIDGGIVIESSQLPIETSDDSVRQRRWVLQIDASKDASLRIEDPRATQKAEIAGLSLREDVRYRTTQRGLEISATWQLDATATLPSELTLPLPAGVELVSAEVDGKELPWRVTRDAEDDTQRVVLTLPEAGRNERPRILVRAWHPLVSELPWQLPTLRPEGVGWAAGTIELAVDDELELREIKPTGCIETGVDGIDRGDASDEIWRYAAYAANAEIEVSVSPRPADAAVRLGTSLAAGDPDISARLVTELNVARGSVHKLFGRLTDEWIVEAVETIPAEALGEWFFDEGESGRRTIEVQLARSATPSSKVSVVVSGRLPRSSFHDRLSVESMRLVRWQNVDSVEHDLTFQSTETFAAEPFGGLPQVAINELGDNRRTLLGSDLLENAVFDLEHAGRDAGLRFIARRGQFTADIDLDLVLGEQERLQTFTLAVRPTSNRIDRLLVYSTERLADGVRWTDAAGAPISAERLAADDTRRTGLPTGGEAWFIALSKPTSRPFEIIVTNTVREAQSELPLLALTEAIQQSGRVHVRGGMQNVASLHTQQMQPAALPSAALEAETAEERGPIRASYRFDPAKCLDTAQRPRLSLLPASDDEVSSVIVERVTIESYYMKGGVGSHEVTYLLRNDGDASFEACLPEGAELQTATVDGRSIATGKTGEDRCIELPLPVGSKSVTATIGITTSGEALSLGSRLEPPMVRGKVPLLFGEWRIRLPEVYSISENGEFSWRQRLLGPLGREEGARPFQPLRPADWIGVVNLLAGLGGNDDSTVASLAGWREYHKSFAADVPAAVYVTHPPLVRSWSVSIFLLSLVAGSFIRRRGWAAFLVLIAAAAGLAIALPATVAPLATGVLIGLAMSLVFGHARQGYATESDSWRSSALTTIGALAFSVTVGLASGSLGQSVDAAVEATKDAGNHEIERLLIPVDDNGQRVGTKYFVSEDFLRELLQFDEAAAAPGGEWLLKDVTFAGELRQGTESSSVVGGEWSISCDVEVLFRETTVALPLVRGEATWPASALVDGVPVPLEWLDAGDGCAITIAEPGEHTVVIEFTPTIAAIGGEQTLSLSVPSHRGATLTLIRPASLKELAVSGTPIERMGSEMAAVEFDLDGEARLALRWPASESTGGGSRHVQITELEWLHINENEVGIDTKYILESDGELPKALTIAHDGDWELAEHEGATVEELQEADASGRRLIQVALARDETPNREVTLRWRLKDARPLGRLNVPVIELVGRPTTQRWRAVSTSPELDCVATIAAAQQATASEFLAVWGRAVADLAPQLAVTTTERSDAWSVEVLPLFTVSEISQAQHIAVGSAAMRVVYEADVLPGTVHRYQFPLIVPLSLTVDEIAVDQSDRPVPVRWVRAADNLINVFFEHELVDEFQLTLRGTVAPAAGGGYRLPVVSADSAVAAAGSVSLYRDEDVLVNVHGLPEAESAGTAAIAPPANWRSRRLRSFRIDEESAKGVQIEVQANKVKLTGDTLTSLHREGESWVACFKCDVAVEEGVLDTLQLLAPPAWQGPFTIDSNVSATVEPPSDADPHVSIRFSDSIVTGDRLQLDIRAPLVATAVPPIRTLPRIRGDRYLSVPAASVGQQLSWNEVGVKAASLPNALVLSAEGRGAQRSFEIVSRPFGLSLAPPAGASHAARIALADTTAACDELGRQLIVTRFAVEPQGVDACELELPEEQRLVAVRLDGRPAVLRRAGESTWRVPLGPPQLPSVLVVTSRLADVGTNGADREIQRPTLFAAGKVVPVDLGLWTFALPVGAARPSIAATAGVTEAEQAVVRFERLLGIAEAGTTAAMESPLPDGDIWLQAWAGRLIRSRDEARELLAAVERAAASQIAPPQDDPLAAASARLEQWLERLGETLREGEAELQSAAPMDVDVFAGMGEDPTQSDWVRCVTAGELDRLKIDVVSAADAARRSQVFGLAVVAFVCGASLMLLRRPEACDFIYRWPHAVGFLAGLAYWAWLRPSWLGILIAVGSLLLGWRSGWPGRAIRMEGSTVLRASRPR